MKPRISRHAAEVRAWVNKHYPKRDKASDGWIGNRAHQARVSDHNPDWETGVVRAIDIDADLVPGAKDRSEAHRLAETLRLKAAAKELPISYIIFAGRICSPRRSWRWRPYKGTSPHYGHIHISFMETPDE